MSSRRRTTGGRGTWLGLFAFISVMLLALGIALGWILPALKVATDVARILKDIAIGIALVIPAIYSFYEARRRGIVWFVLWVIAIILVAVFYILPFFNII